MANKKFRIAFSTIAVTPFFNFIRLVTKYPVHGRYLGRCLVAGLVSLIAEPFRLIEQLFYSRKLARMPMPQSPVFILGHWRSGTTLLHNLMCEDKQFAFITTYQSVFVNQFFASRWLFKPLMKLLIPEKRPADNVLLSPEFPQEEGFALCNMNSYAFYNFWYFPNQWKLFYDTHVTGKGLALKQMRKFNNRYKKLVAQSLLEHKKTHFVSKNPVNTACVKQIRDIFPDAKFIYIYRNPLMVFHSTCKFFAAVMETLRLQEFSTEQLEEMIFELYERLIRDYETQKAEIPAHRLVEIRYEDFVKSPVEQLQLIYSALQLNGFEEALPDFMTYLDSQKKFVKNKHRMDKLHLEKIMSRWAFAMQQYGYTVSVPDESNNAATEQPTA